MSVLCVTMDRLTRVARSVTVSALCAAPCGTCDSGRYSGVQSERKRDLMAVRGS